MPCALSYIPLSRVEHSQYLPSKYSPPLSSSFSISIHLTFPITKTMAPISVFEVPENMAAEDVEAAWILLDMRVGTNAVSEHLAPSNNDTTSSLASSIEEDANYTTNLGEETSPSSQGTTPTQDTTSSQAPRPSSRKPSLPGSVVYNSKWHPMDDTLKPKRAAKVRESMGEK